MLTVEPPKEPSGVEPGGIPTQGHTAQKDNIKKEISFFEQFTPKEIFSKWNSSNTLLELAQHLGFTGSDLTRADYEHVQSLKDRTVWREDVLKSDRHKERTRFQRIGSLDKNELESIMDSPGIETLSHLALHFLVSQKHGRGALRKRIIDLGI